MQKFFLLIFLLPYSINDIYNIVNIAYIYVSYLNLIVSITADLLVILKLIIQQIIS